MWTFCQCEKEWVNIDNFFLSVELQFHYRNRHCPVCIRDDVQYPL